MEGPVSQGPSFIRPTVRSTWLSLKRFLRSPWTIMGELLGVALVGVLSTVVPQATDLAATGRLRADHPVLHRLLETLWLDRVLHGPPFLVLLAVATGSLTLVLVELTGRARREWPTPTAEAVIRRAQYQEAFTVAARLEAREVVEVRSRFGLLGAPLFHAGLLLVVLAGVLRAVLGVDAVVQVHEGELLPAGPDAFPHQTGGPLAGPFGLRASLSIGQLQAGLHETGGLAALALPVTVGSGPAEDRLLINTPLDLGPNRLYLSAETGPAAFLIIEAPGERRQEVLFMSTVGEGAEVSTGAGPLLLRLSTPWSGLSQRPAGLTYRALSAGVLAGVGRLGLGETAQLPGGVRLTLVDLRRWVELRGRRDPSVELALGGFALAIAGAAAMFLVTRVETAVRVEPLAGGSRVTVALRAQRFAPLHADAFHALVAQWRSRPPQEEPPT